jgi:hypothetical protein
MTKIATIYDRSLAFTALLEVPEFREMDDKLTDEVITKFLADWREAYQDNMVEYAKEWFAFRIAEEQAFKDAYHIAWPGAVNPTAIAHTLAKDSGPMVRFLGTSGACNHPALQVIAGQLAYLYHLSLGPSIEALDAVAEKAKELGIWVEGL